ncbi:MAG: hypothetical protein PVG14_02360 [Anaerolineales bacterium]|jgi:hypothetical protein
MPFYSSAESLYTVMRTLFEHLRQDASNPVDALVASRLVVRFDLDEPAASITINGRRKPVQVTYGDCSDRPVLDAQLSADTLHRVLLDEIPLKKAIADRALKVRGPVWKTRSMAEILRQGRAYYPQVLRDHHLLD